MANKGGLQTGQVSHVRFPALNLKLALFDVDDIILGRAVIKQSLAPVGC